MAANARSFEEYWLAFVRAHSHPSTRRLVFAAVSAGIGSAAAGVLARRPLLLLLSPFIAFGPTLLAQKIAGKAAVLAAAHPLFYLLSSLKMWRMILRGTIDGEVARAMAEERAPDHAARAAQTGHPGRERDEAEAPYPRPNMVTDHTLH
jgi:hypothetical protein